MTQVVVSGISFTKSLTSLVEPKNRGPFMCLTYTSSLKFSGKVFSSSQTSMSLSGATPDVCAV